MPVSFAFQYQNSALRCRPVAHLGSQVVATYIQQGFVIKQRNNQYNYLVVEDPATSHVVSRAEAQAAVTATRQAAQPLNASEAQAAAAAVSQARQSRDINLVPTAIPATPKSTIAVRAIDAAKSRLAGVDGVAGVQHSPRVQLLGRSRYSRRGVDDSGLAVVSSASKYRRRLSTASCPTETLDTYGTQAGYVDMVTGRTSEEAPYGISMIQADFSTMTDISSNYNGKVLFCVIDDGLDVNNPEFSPGRQRDSVTTQHWQQALNAATMSPDHMILWLQNFLSAWLDHHCLAQASHKV